MYTQDTLSMRTAKTKIKLLNKRAGNLQQSNIDTMGNVPSNNAIIIIIVISLKQSLPNAYAWFKKTKIQGTIQHAL